MFFNVVSITKQDYWVELDEYRPEEVFIRVVVADLKGLQVFAQQLSS